MVRHRLGVFRDTSHNPEARKTPPKRGCGRLLGQIYPGYAVLGIKKFTELALE